MQAVSLGVARAAASPVAVLQSLADECKALGIDASDVYGDFSSTKDSSWLRRFEAEVAADLGKEDALFLPSGVMAQSIALLIHRDAARARAQAADGSAGSTFMAHFSSHLLIHEQAGYDKLLGMCPLVVPASPAAVVQEPLSCQDVAAALDRHGQAGGKDSDVAAVLLEMPHREIGGKCTAWADVQAMSSLCRSRGIALHMDGARLWEAYGSPAYDGLTRADLCGPFDSVYVSFYKGLGGITGAMLAGSKGFIAEARVWLRRFGGNLYTLLPYAVSAWAGFRDLRESFGPRQARLAQVLGAIMEACYGAGAELGPQHPYCHPVTGAPLLRLDPPVPQVSMVHMYMACSPDQATEARDKAAARAGIFCFPRVRGPGQHGASSSCYIELNMGPLEGPAVANGAVPVDTWVRGWRALLEDMRESLLVHKEA